LVVCIILDMRSGKCPFDHPGGSNKCCTSTQVFRFTEIRGR
jgi:hypothetical protein